MENSHLKHVHVPAFDGIRGLVFTVMFVHLENFIPIFADHRRTTFLLVDHTWITLNIFFCLSGFLITWLLATEMQTTGSVDLLRFYKRRTVRLLPAYLTAIIVAGVVALTWGHSLKEVIHDAALFLTYSYNVFFSFSPQTAATLGIFLLPAWSLCVEEQFYFSWSVALKRLTLRRALPAVICALVGLRIYRCALLFWMQSSGHSPYLIFQRFYFGTDTRIDAILVGCAAALVLQNRRYYDFARKYLKVKALPYVLPVAVALVVFLTAPTNLTDPAYQSYGAEITNALMVMWFVTILFQPESLVSRILASRPMVFIGRISYGLYLFHCVVIAIVVRALGTTTLPYSLYRNLTAWSLATAGTLVLASVHYYLIERPLLNKFKRPAPISTQPEAAKNTAPARQIPDRKRPYMPELEKVLS